MSNLILGIAQNSRYKETAGVAIDAGLGLRSKDVGKTESSVLPAVMIVKRRANDLLRFIEEGLIDAAFISDETGMESLLGANGADLGVKRGFGLQIDEWDGFNSDEKRVAIPKMTMLARREDALNYSTGLSNVFAGTDKQVTISTSFPKILEAYVSGKLRKAGSDRPTKDVFNTVYLDGQVERPLRDGFPDVDLAYDMVETGGTAERLKLAQLEEDRGDERFVVLPSLWLSKARGSSAEDLCGLVKEAMLRTGVPITDRMIGVNNWL